MKIKPKNLYPYFKLIKYILKILVGLNSTRYHTSVEGGTGSLNYIKIDPIVWIASIVSRYVILKMHMAPCIQKAINVPYTMNNPGQSMPKIFDIKPNQICLLMKSLCSGMGTQGLLGTHISEGKGEGKIEEELLQYFRDL